MHKIGIIAEYNPFHNGHLYQIKEIKKRKMCDNIKVRNLKQLLKKILLKINVKLYLKMR